jgi:hypothetical protein
MGLVRLVVRVILWVIRWIYLIVRFLTPWLLRVVGWAATLMVNTLILMWEGIRPGMRNIAEGIVARAAMNIPINLRKPLYYLAYVVAVLTVLAGWLLLAHLTVWLWNRLLRLL